MGGYEIGFSSMISAITLWRIAVVVLGVLNQLLVTIKNDTRPSGRGLDGGRIMTNGNDEFLQKKVCLYKPSQHRAYMRVEEG